MTEKAPRPESNDCTEQARLNAARESAVPWKKWGPYLSERQWGTVREDYSDNGDAWNYFTHDQARSRAYRWGEDGIAGVSDDRQRLCLALALWNGNDPILKERMFGLANSEANHGEDVKEYYFYLDSTPTHSYMKYLYTYPQREYPYRDLVETNRSRSRAELEYELLDTGVFADDRYFDVFVEYAKNEPEDLLVKVSVHNRGPEPATLHVLLTLWFRNTPSWEQGGAARAPRRRESGRGTMERPHHQREGSMTVQTRSARAATLLMAAGLCACATATKFASKYDSAADFSKYTSYAFDAGRVIDDPDHQRLAENVINQELGAKGFRLDASSPDLLIGLAPLGAGESEGGMLAAGTVTWSYQGPYDGIMISSGGLGYKDAEMSVIMKDAKTGNQVWRGVISGKLSYDDREGNYERAVETLRKLMRSFPPKGK
jgi:hypothetical protein